MWWTQLHIYDITWKKWTAWMLAMQSLRLLDTASFEVNLPCSFHDCQSQMIAMIIARG